MPGKAKSEARIVVLLVDGMADVALPQLDDCTPLQVADTPMLDAIAGVGVNGLMDAVETGRACGSDTAHLALFGYDPRSAYRGRGAFEALGAGCTMDAGDIAFKSNLATIDDESGVVTHRRVDRDFDEEGPVLCAHIDGLDLPAHPECRVQVRYATEHRCGVVIHGTGLSDDVTDTDPLKDNLPLRQSAAAADTPEAKRTADIINYVSDRFRERLKDHPINQERSAQGKNPANVVLLRGGGVRMALPTFQAKHSLRACIVAPTKVLGGLGMTLGMEWLPAPGATGSYDSAFHAKAAAICDAVINKGFQFGFCHVKAVDDCGHDRLWGLKVRYIERMDALMAQVARRLHEAEQANPDITYLVAVTADHSTPVSFGDHSHEPVPCTFARIADVVARVGATAVRAQDLGPLPPLSQHDAVPLAELRAQMERQRQARTGVLTASQQVTVQSASLPDVASSPAGNSAAASQAAGTGTPSDTAGDNVVLFDEVAAARGALGRFPSSEFMPLVRSLLAAAT